MMDSGLQTFNNFILIAGTGRNAGKTMLACKIIHNLSEILPVIAVKISNHFHPTEKGQKIIAENSGYRIILESLNTDKDSSRMKKAGAKISFYIQSKQKYLFEAVMNLPFDVKSGPVLCESGGLHRFIKPGLFFLVEGDTIPANKTTAFQFNPIRVKFNNGNFNINLQNIRFKNNCFTFKIVSMNTYSKVKQIIKEVHHPVLKERIELGDSLKRVLQEDIVADMFMPPFDKSAMDGYACRRSDVGNEMEVLEVIQAGKLPVQIIGKNQCSKIMTGAAIPEGADCVFMVEDAEAAAGNKVRCTNQATKSNICFRGEDFRTGDILIPNGERISPAHIGTMVGAGYTQVTVSKLPTVAVMATGNELVDPGKKPCQGQIRNSNSIQLMSQLKSLGINASNLGIVEDDIGKISACFENSIRKHDLIIVTGGASKGDFDFIPHVMEETGFEILIERTGIKPGNPMTFSKKGTKYCFGLSGNPVSSFVQFEFFVKPFLFNYLGSNWKPLRYKGVLKQDFFRKNGTRFGVFPVKIDKNNLIEETLFHGSAHINALPNANALMEVPEGNTHLKKGEEAYVRRI